jgi:hypothetical protein
LGVLPSLPLTNLGAGNRDELLGFVYFDGDEFEYAGLDQKILSFLQGNPQLSTEFGQAVSGAPKETAQYGQHFHLFAIFRLKAYLFFPHTAASLIEQYIQSPKKSMITIPFLLNR